MLMQNSRLVSRLGYMPADGALMSIQCALQKALGDTVETSAARTMSVRLDVREDEKSFQIVADLPGLSDKEVEVSFDAGVLTIKGNQETARDEKSGTWHLIERSSGSFIRKVALKAPIETTQIEAKFDKGVLTINLPKKAPEETAHKIEIKTV